MIEYVSLGMLLHISVRFLIERSGRMEALELQIGTEACFVTSLRVNLHSVHLWHTRELYIYAPRADENLC